MSQGPLTFCYLMMYGTSFKHQVKQRVDKTQVEVCQRRGKSFIEYFEGPLSLMSQGPLTFCYLMMYGTSFKHQVKQRVDKTQVEVCQRRGKSFIEYFEGPFINIL